MRRPHSLKLFCSRIPVPVKAVRHKTAVNPKAAKKTVSRGTAKSHGTAESRAMDAHSVTPHVKPVLSDSPGLHTGSKIPEKLPGIQQKAGSQRRAGNPETTGSQERAGNPGKQETFVTPERHGQTSANPVQSLAVTLPALPVRIWQSLTAELRQTVFWKLCRMALALSAAKISFREKMTFMWLLHRSAGSI